MATGAVHFERAGGSSTYETPRPACIFFPQHISAQCDRIALYQRVVLCERQHHGSVQFQLFNDPCAVNMTQTHT